MTTFTSLDMDEAGPSMWYQRSDDVPERLNAEWFVTAAAAESFEEPAASASAAVDTDALSKEKKREVDNYNNLWERDFEWELENETFDGRFGFLENLQPSPATLQPSRRDSTSAAPSATSDPKVSISRNTPIQIAVVIGSVVLFATLACGLAWMFRTSCGRRRQRRLSRKGNAWSPGATSSVFTDDSEGHKVDAKAWAHQATLATPLPQLRDASPGEKERRQSWLAPVTRPEPAHTDGPGARPSSTGRGWELFDGPVHGVGSELSHAAGSRHSQLSGRGGNYAAAHALAQAEGRIPDVTDMRSTVSGCPPARQPTFIARVLAQRAGTGSMLSSSESNGPMTDAPSGPWARANLDAIMTLSPQPIQQQLPPQQRQQQARTAPRTGLSARDAFRSVLGLRPAQRSPAIDDSDFEGTIGAKDGEVPAARRLGKREPRFSLDGNTTVPNRSPLPPTAAPIQENITDEKLLEQPVAAFSVQLPNGPTPIIAAYTPKTPGLAGVGAAWVNGKSELRASLLSTGPLVPAVPPKEPKELVSGPPVFEVLRRQEALAEMERRVKAVENGTSSGPATAKLVATISQWIEAARDADPVGWNTPLLRNASAASVLSSLSGSSNTRSAKGGVRSWRADSEQASEIFVMLEKYTMATSAPKTPLATEPEEGTEIAFGLPSSPGSGAMLPYLAKGDKASMSNFSISLYAKPSMLRKPETAYVADMRLISPKQRAEPIMVEANGGSSRRTRHSASGTSASEYTSLTSIFDDAPSRIKAAAVAAKGFAPAPSIPNVVAEVSSRDVNWNHQDEVAENAKREIDRRQKTLRKEQRRIAREMAQEQRRIDEDRETEKRQAQAKATAATVAAATAKAAAASARRRRSSIAPGKVAKRADPAIRVTPTSEGERSRPRKSVSNDIAATATAATSKLRASTGAQRASKPAVASQPAQHVPTKLSVSKRDALAPRHSSSTALATRNPSKPRTASAAPRIGMLPASGPYPQRRVMSTSRRGPTPSPPDSPWTSPASEAMAAGSARVASGKGREPGSFIVERRRSRSAAFCRPSIGARRPSNGPAAAPAPRSASVAVAMPPAPKPAETKTTAQLQAEARRGSIAGHTLASAPLARWVG